MKTSSKLLLSIARQLPRGYARLIRLAARNDPALHDFPIKLDRFPRELRADLRENVFIPMLLKGEIPHQRGLDLFAMRHVTPGDTVFDIGANVGYTTALFSHLCGPSGQVVSFEPSRRTFELLKKSMAPFENVALKNMAVASMSEEREFFTPDMSDLASFEPREGAHKETVTTTTLDDMCEAYGTPALIKVDVEGFEVEVFKGGQALFASDTMPMIVFEACDTGHLSACTDILNALSGGHLSFGRLRQDGALPPCR
ncbi:MAG: FkbM family methyltransferase [Pseudomonadota bacterium]